MRVTSEEDGRAGALEDRVDQRIDNDAVLARAQTYPQLRFMGSKFRLLPWLHATFAELDFDTAHDPFCGSGCVAYLLKSMGKEVTTGDFLNFPTTIARALIENSRQRVGQQAIERLLRYDPKHPHFIERTFRGIFFTAADLRFLDRVWWNLRRLRGEARRALVLSALIRSCVKRQPRGVFTVAGDPERYKDDRRDLRLSLREHFVEQIDVYNRAVFCNGRRNRATRADVSGALIPGALIPDASIPDAPVPGASVPRGACCFDLVYLDPPYVPRADDNCYVKRYHFLEGLSCYWQDLPVLTQTRVKKIAKPYTPFSYRRTAIEAFDHLFRRYAASIQVLSYSSNGYPDLERLVDLMRRYKARVDVVRRDHRYHFGTHAAVARAQVQEYLIIGR